MPSTRLISERIRAEQLRLLMRQMPAGIIANLLIALLTVGLLTGVVPSSRLMQWFLIFTLVMAGRGLLWWRYRRAPPPRLSVPKWLDLTSIAAALTGVLWGAGAALLFPDDALARVLLIFVIGGMSAGAVGVDSAHLRTMVAFLLPANMILAGRLFAEGAALYTGMGGMVLIFMTTLGLTGRHLNRALRKTLRLRFELAERSRALAETNSRLLAEMAEHRSTEAALRQAQKLEAIGQLTGNIAHDFNNLLTAVIGNLEMAIALTADQDDSARWQHSALHAAQRGASLTQRLLAFTRKQSVNPKPCDIGALAHSSVTLLQRMLGGNIRLEITTPDRPVPARVDETQLELVVLNLAINSRDAMPDGGVLHISVETRLHHPGHEPPHPASRVTGSLKPGDYVVLTVTDSGSGMPDAVLARAFEPFFTTKGVGAGSGLGLSIVQGFAEQSGGCVRLTSHPGAGTWIELWLPRADAAEPTDAAEPASSASAMTASKTAARILLCDDDRDVRAFLAAYLRRLGYRVEDSGDPAAALATLETGGDFDLLIADYTLPGWNGIELIKAARTHQPALSAILTTGHGEAIGTPDGSRAVADGLPVLAKPFEPAMLARQIAQVMTRRTAVGAPVRGVS